MKRKDLLWGGLTPQWGVLCNWEIILYKTMLNNTWVARLEDYFLESLQTIFNNLCDKESLQSDDISLSQIVTALSNEV